MSSTLLQGLMASRLITPPAIWGKLPGHADFVRSHMRHGESEGWQPWLAEQGRQPAMDAGAGAGTASPAAFVLPPGTLDFARRRFVVGVIAPSRDKVGRHHPLLVYQLAHARWIRAQFDPQAAQPQDWLFWLARAVARHTHSQQACSVQALERTVQGLWRLHAPQVRDLWGGQAASHGLAGGVEARSQAMQDVLDRWAGPVRAEDPAAQKHGVRFFPWTDWPQRLYREGGEAAFWQQDAAGGYVNAVARLPMLWSVV